MQTKNMTIRKFGKFVDDLGMYRIRKTTTLPDDYAKRVYHYSIFNCYTNENLKKIYMTSGEQNYRQFAVEVGMIIMVMICDTFEYLRTKEKLQGLEDVEQILLDRIIAGIKYNDYKYILNDPYSLEYCVSVTQQYMEESALRKIELAKSLSEVDVASLSKSNVYFEEEYNHYNIEITEEFLLRHLNIWIKKSGVEEGINTIAKFILNMYILDSENFTNIASIIVPDEDKRQNFIEELNNKDLNTIAPYISNFYESHKEINKELK